MHVWRIKGFLASQSYFVLQHDCFCHFLECYSLNNHREIVNLYPEIVTMNWQTLDNVIDRGVFVMRHLESYMGNKAAWSCGLRSELVCTKNTLVLLLDLSDCKLTYICNELQDNQKYVLQKLRSIYAHRILMWTKNKKRHLVMQKMVNYTKSRMLGV